MKINNILLLAVILVGCSKVEPRRPIHPKPTTTIYTKTLAYAKKLKALEEKAIQNYITLDSLNEYNQSKNGFWYSYKTKINDSLPQPKKGDTVTFSYDVRLLNDSIIYAKEALGNITYIVDKQEMITGIQTGIKLMKKGETVTFIFPSYNAFGVAGDGDKIGINQTIKSTLTLLNIK